MRKALVIVLAIAAAVGVVTLRSGAGEEGRYLVRAVFDSAASAIPDEDVRVAGVNVGGIEEIDLTSDQKAAVVLRIDHPDFQNFRADATCTVRTQSLIGEKFVECTPTQPRAPGEPRAPELPVIPEGKPGAGQRFLPVEQTSSPVDFDLLQNVVRRPYNERLRILVNELGGALAGRGEDLREVIRRANPALRETDRVLAILARQNRVLADLARDSDRALAPLARERRRASHFIESAGKAAAATAERGRQLERNLERFPPFLRELQLTMDRFADFARQATPVFHDLRVAAPDVSRFFVNLRPLASSATPALESLGDAGAAGIPALAALRPVAGRLGELGAGARSLAPDLSSLLGSLRDSDGIEELMKVFVNVTATQNALDRLGHFLRVSVVVNACATYAVKPQFDLGCVANYGAEPAAAARASRAAQAPRRAAPEDAATLIDYLLGSDSSDPDDGSGG